jgi:outer membrane protein assembly factor BamB
VLYGALTYYNEERGHLIELSSEGAFTASYDFGWDVTPAVVSDAAGDRVYVKDNHYFGTNFEGGPYWLTELDLMLRPIWQFQSTEINSCTRQPDGTVTCTPDHPHGFEWCINAPAVDHDGTMYANSEDGNLYAIRSNGELRDRFFLGKALGASYTPLAIDHVGRVYALNAGHLLVVGAN